MTRATTPMREFARRLMVSEPGGNKAGATKIPAGFQACEQLRRHLAGFMGNTGFHTLLARSLALAIAEVPGLRTVRLNADGSLAGLEELAAQPGPSQTSEGGEVLLAQLLGLLVAFIGEDLTVRLVREVWPRVSLVEVDFGPAGKNGDGRPNENRGKNEGKNAYQGKNEKNR